MTGSSSNRRAVLRSILAAGAVAAIPVAASAAPEADPVFAAIEAHRAAWAAVVDAMGRTDKVAARREGRAVTRPDIEAKERADEAEEGAREALQATSPTTMAGLRAALAYFVEWEDGCIPDESVEHLKTILRSPILADRGRA